jgi:hypothetical protein
VSRPVTPLERMAGTTRLELATSAVTDGKSPTGGNGISRLDTKLPGPTGCIGSCWDILCNDLCNEISCSFCYIFPRYLVNDFTKRPSSFPYTPIPQSVFPGYDAGV